MAVMCTGYYPVDRLNSTLTLPIEDLRPPETYIYFFIKRC